MSSFDYNAPAELFLAKTAKGSRTSIDGSQRPLRPSVTLLSRTCSCLRAVGIVILAPLRPVNAGGRTQEPELENTICENRSHAAQQTTRMGPPIRSLGVCRLAAKQRPTEKLCHRRRARGPAAKSLLAWRRRTWIVGYIIVRWRVICKIRGRRTSLVYTYRRRLWLRATLLNLGLNGVQPL
jgi:hypothetical protein